MPCPFVTTDDEDEFFGLPFHQRYRRPCSISAISGIKRLTRVVLPVPRGAWTFICFPYSPGFDGVQDFDVERSSSWKHLVAGSTDVVFHEEIGSKT